MDYFLSLILFKRNRTPRKHIYYALHLYFSGLSLRKVSQHLSPLIKKRNHMYQFGIGFNTTSQKGNYIEKEKGFMNL
jgi:hypothetical protein